MNVTNLIHQLLERWLTIILESTGAAVAIAFEDDAEERLKSARRGSSQGAPTQPGTSEANLGTAGTCMGTTGAWRCRR